MLTNTDSQRIAIADLHAPSQVLTRAEANMVKGGNKALDMAKKYCLPPKSTVAAVACGAAGGVAAGRWLDEKFGISDWLADKLYDLFH